jgi:EmrB/QacA subfamily drug resistance transporter
MVELILFRAIQGFGGGGLMVTAQATVGDIVPPQERGRYQGLFGAVFGVATVIGPLMGGFFVEQLSWRWIFYVNVPLGILSLGVIAVSLRAPVTRRAHVIDYPGAALIAVALTCLVLATSLGGTTYAWSSPQILGLIGAGLFLAGVFVLVERHAAEPVLPLELFRNRVFTVASMTGLIVGFALFGSVTFMPLYLQVVQGKSPTTAGLLMSPMMAGLLVTSIASGRLIMRVGRYKPFPIAGTAITTVGLLLLSRLDAGSSLLAASLSMLVLGLGLGAVMQVLVLAVQNAVDYEHLGVATSGTTLFRSIGGSIGVSVFGAIFANQLHGNLSAELGGKATQLPNTLEPRALNALPSALHHAYVVAFAEALHPVFLAAAAVALLAFALTWLLREQPLRRTVEGSGPSESFAVPRDQTSLEEIERALTSLASRENRVRLYQRLATRAGLDLSPRATWLLARLGEAPETDRADLSQRFRLEPDRLELAIEELAVAGLAADGGRVTLTPSGSAAHTRLVAARREGLAELLTEWSPEEHADVAAMLSRLARAMTAEAPPAAG